MKRLIALSVLSILLVNSSNAQITKGNWIVGGNGYYTSTKTKRLSVGDISKSSILRISPSIGYFIIDKLPVGLQGLIDHEKIVYVGSNENKSTYYFLGVFARYYFLPADGVVNLFTEANYNKQIADRNESISFTAGPVLYFNSSVGLEFTLGYIHNNYNDADVKSNNIQFRLGFQIHLQKDKGL